MDEPVILKIYSSLRSLILPNTIIFASDISVLASIISISQTRTEVVRRSQTERAKPARIRTPAIL